MNTLILSVYEIFVEAKTYGIQSSRNERTVEVSTLDVDVSRGKTEISATFDDIWNNSEVQTSMNNIERKIERLNGPEVKEIRKINQEQKRKITVVLRGEYKELKEFHEKL